MAYATTTQLSAETAARKTADAALDARLKKLEAPPAPVPPSGNIVPFVAGDTWSHFQSLVVDATVSEITLSGDYRPPLNGLHLGGGMASATPVRIRRADGQQYRFLGAGYGDQSHTMPGVVLFGDPDNGVAPFVRPMVWEDLVVDQCQLAQSGVLELRRISDATFLRPVATYTRDKTWSGNAEYKTYMGYTSSKAGGGVHRIVVDGARAYDALKARSVSFWEFDSFGEVLSDFTIRNAYCEHMAFALYQAIPGTGYVLDNWTIVDSGRNGASVRLIYGQGTYHAINYDAASGGIQKDSTSQMVAV